MTKRETLATAKTLTRDITRNKLHLGRVFLLIQEEGWFFPQYANLHDYAWGDLGLKRSTCYAAMQMAQAVERFGLSDASVERVGWTKFYMLCPHLTRENCREMLEFAGCATRTALERRLRGTGLQKGFSGLDQYDLDVVDRAIGDAKAVLGAETEAAALVAICETFTRAL